MNKRIIFILLMAFVVALPFHAHEYDLFGIGRFELKLTVLYFILLFTAWFGNSMEYPRRRSRKELVFYALAFMYGASQFLSLINSFIPDESIRQAIIIACFLLIMVVISEVIPDKKTAESILNVMGILSLVIGVWSVIHYYLFTHHLHRLGQYCEDAVRGTIFFGGDPVYFGDLLLYSIGGVFFAALNLYGKKRWGWTVWPILLLWFSAIILTYTKGLYIAVISFFLSLLFIMKERRAFALMGMAMFILAAALNVNGPTYFYTIKAKMESKNLSAAQKAVSSVSKRDTSVLPVSKRGTLDPSTSRVNASLLCPETKVEPVKPKVEPVETKKEEKIPKKSEIEQILDNRKDQILNRLDMTCSRGINSFAVRLRAILISLKCSIEHFWFGNGAGLSPWLLQDMAADFDKNFNEKILQFMRKNYLEGLGANGELVDAHNIFLTEFLNVGMIGALFLICLVVFVLSREAKTIKASQAAGDNMNELIFATLIAMLVSRMTNSMITIPSLWFILGLGFGITKLYDDSIHRPR